MSIIKKSTLPKVIRSKPDTTSMYICKFCQKVYYNKQSKYETSKKCKEEHDSLTKTIRQMEEKHKKEMKN